VSRRHGHEPDRGYRDPARLCHDDLTEPPIPAQASQCPRPHGRRRRHGKAARPEAGCTKRRVPEVRDVRPGGATVGAPDTHASPGECERQRGSDRAPDLRPRRALGRRGPRASNARASREPRRTLAARRDPVVRRRAICCGLVPASVGERQRRRRRVHTSHECRHVGRLWDWRVRPGGLGRDTKNYVRNNPTPMNRSGRRGRAAALASATTHAAPPFGQHCQSGASVASRPSPIRPRRGRRRHRGR
jgi:hypothetical protein